jgi:two-component system chemotaxis response regulator CheY
MSRYNFDKLYFLVVDDNRHMRFIIASILRSFGARFIFEAEDGTEAIRQLHATPIDIVICDWLMEPMDGCNFVKHIRSAPDSPDPYIPIIALSAYTEYHRVTSARDSGASEFLAKPIASKTLFERVAAIINEPRPFVDSENYKGPDRRRHRSETFIGIDKRAPVHNAQDEMLKIQPGEGSKKMSEKDLDVLLKKTA